jgi:hypothetical protein
MKRTRKFPLRLEALDDRFVPSVVSLSFSGGSLTVRTDNLPNNLAVTQTGPGYKVTDNGASLGSYALTGNLSVTMGNGNDTVALNLTTGLPGGLTVNLGNGTDTFTTAGSSTSAVVGGNTTINTGYGADILDLYNLSYGGQVTNVIGAPTGDRETLDARSTRFAGLLNVSNIWLVGLGDPTTLGPVTAGQLVVNNSQKNTTTNPSDPLSGNFLNIGLGTRIAGNATYVGGPGNDEAGVFGFNNGALTPSVVGGNFTVVGGSGINTVFLGLGDPTFGPGQVNGGVSFTGGNGADRFFLDTGSSVGGDVALNLGDGANQLFLGTVAAANGTGFTIGGNFSATMGSGDDLLAMPSAPSSVGGNFYLSVGGGTQSFTWDNNLSVGGRFDYRASFGTNTLNLDSTTFGGPMDVVLGGGDSTVSFGAGATAGSATIDFGVGFGSKSFSNVTPITFPFLLLNYP